MNSNINHLRNHSDIPIEADRFLVCGLGRLGQHCVAALKQYGARVSAVDITLDKFWEFDGLADLVEYTEVGDCRDPAVLGRAGISRCRAVLVVTNDERINIEAALAARTINPNVRLVIRSNKNRLNALLRQQLGNFVAFEPTELSGPAFALAALGEETIGCFKLEGRVVEVIRRTITAESIESGRSLDALDTNARKILAHAKNGDRLRKGFHQWKPDDVVEPGDTLVFIETRGMAGFAFSYLYDQNHTENETGRVRLPKPRPVLLWNRIKRETKRLLNVFSKNQVGRVAGTCGLVSAALVLLGSLMFRFSGLGMGWVDSLYATVVLLLGGFADIMNSELRFSLPAPWWLRLFGLFLTVSGTVLVGVIFALLTGSIIASRFQFRRRPGPPHGDHAILVGLGRVGRRVAEMLEEYSRPWIGLIRELPEKDLFPHKPVLGGDVYTNLVRSNLKSADSVIAVTNDEMLNLEICLIARAVNPNCRLVLRTYHKRFHDHVAQLFPYARVLCVAELVAEAFAAASFGEQVPSLFHLDQYVILVTQYRVEAGDTLNGRLISEVAYGFGIQPLVYWSPETGRTQWMPSEDILLKVGDRLTVLADTAGLRRVECNEPLPRNTSVHIESVLTQDSIYEGAGLIAKIAGCKMEAARRVMDNAPASLPFAMYGRQADRLARSLRRARVLAEVVPLEDE